VSGQTAEIRALGPAEAAAAVPALSEVLIDCVARGASVSFMWPLDRREADAFWRGVADGVAAGERILLAAFEDGELAGTVQVIAAPQPNQPHRADIAKMLVRGASRRKGLGEALMGAAEAAAGGWGKTLLVLDTVTGGDAERLYTRLGWERVGVIPDYALFPDGRPCATTVFYRRLAA
jgi:GNAT superfamily N-acetyltransferase